MMHEIVELDQKGLREFGLVTGAIVAGLFGLFFPWLLEIGTPLWPWVVGGVLSIWGLAAPLTLRPVYRLWMKFGLLLSRITTPLVLGILFFGMFVPTALIMRLFQRDPMARKLDDGTKTYRIASHKVAKETMERPF
ncbi:MAG: sxtJ [Candidatus Thiodiazotropha sp. (ex Dulcina madagascariensis)]|nr:sxtJ [Candidatus Thiodiazotropha sp. (ex Dulcina madagascariensis)]MCU7924970.1 sxtJ [Candidatus Thiodiazotropha sp. (ex Dulcina madagascariensis)]